MPKIFVSVIHSVFDFPIDSTTNDFIKINPFARSRALRYLGLSRLLHWLKFGANRAPSKIDSTINLSFLLSKEFGADCKLYFDDDKLTFGVIKVPLSHQLNASLVSKILLTRFV